MGQENANQKTVVVVSTKSTGIAIILTVIFGPLGMFYSTIPGAIIMTILTLILGIVTLGFLWWLTWPVCIIWGAMSANSYNKKILSGQREY